MLRYRSDWPAGVGDTRQRSDWLLKYIIVPCSGPNEIDESVVKAANQTIAAHKKLSDSMKEDFALLVRRCLLPSGAHCIFS